VVDAHAVRVVVIAVIVVVVVVAVVRTFRVLVGSPWLTEAREHPFSYTSAFARYQAT
jgi:hypothetical protein